MPKRQNMARIALELNEADFREMQQGLDAFNAVFAPLRLSRSDLLRAALREKLAAPRRSVLLGDCWPSTDIRPSCPAIGRIAEYRGATRGVRELAIIGVESGH